MTETTATIDSPAPELQVASWVQGKPVTFADLAGDVILVEVFQVNCPSCFLFALPEAIRLHDLYADQGLYVMGLATAFEDYEMNTLENLEALVTSGSVVGETLKALEQQGELVEGKFRWKIPFAVAMDEVVEDHEPVTEEKILQYAKRLHPDMLERRAEEQDYIHKMVKQYLQQKTMSAKTFESYNLRGTPSSILIDREGILRDISLGQQEKLEEVVRKYLD